MRLFVAVKLQKNEAAVANLLGDLARLDAAIRWVRPEGAHLTLKFLGEVKEQNLPLVKEIIASCCQAHVPFLLGLGGFGLFPNSKLPRVFFVEVSRGQGALAALAKDLEERLSMLGFEKEKMGFHPHLTLGRSRRAVSPHSVRNFLGQPAPLWDEERIEEISLMKSELRPQGAQYQALEEFPLRGFA